MNRATLLAMGFFTLSTLFWAGNIIAGRIAGADIGPVTLSTSRWLIAFVLILPFAWRHVAAERALYRRHWRVVLLVAVLNVASYNTLIYWGLNHTTAINAAVLNSAFPVAVFALTWLLGQERATRFQLGGMLLAVTGVLWVALRGDAARLADLSLNPGDLAILLALACFATYSVVLRRMPVRFNPVGLLGVQIGLGVLLLMPLLVLETSRIGVPAWQPHMTWIFLYVGLFPSVLAHICWLNGVELGGANLSGIMYNLIPVFAIALAVPVLGERLEAHHVVGVVLIFSGIYLAVFRRRESSSS